MYGGTGDFWFSVTCLIQRHPTAYGDLLTLLEDLVS